MILRRDAGIFQELTVVRTPRPPTRLHSIFAFHFTLSLIFCSCSTRLCNISCRENSSLLYSCSPSHFRLADAPRCALLLAGQAAAQAELPTSPTRHAMARQILKVQQPSPPSCAFGSLPRLHRCFLLSLLVQSGHDTKEACDFSQGEMAHSITTALGLGQCTQTSSGSPGASTHGWWHSS